MQDSGKIQTMIFCNRLLCATVTFFVLAEAVLAQSNVPEHRDEANTSRTQRDAAREIILSTGGSMFIFGNEKIGVRFIGHKVLSKNFDRLREIANLAAIQFVDASLSDSELSHLTGLKQVVELSIRNGRTTRTSQQFNSAHITDTGIEMLERMPQLEKLELESVPVTDKSLAIIAKLPALKSLSLIDLAVSPPSFRLLRNRYLTSIAIGGPYITDEVFDHLPLDQIEEFSIEKCDLNLSKVSEIPKLKSLRIESTEYGGSDLKILATSTNLTSLRLHCPIDDNALASVQSLSRVKMLVIRSNRTTDKSVFAISQMPELEDLELRGEQYTVAAWNNLAKCQTLKRLCLMVTSISNSDLALFADYPCLERLELKRAQRVSDRGIDNLSRANQLIYINLDDTKISKTGFKKLERLLPKCNIDWHKN